MTKDEAIEVLRKALTWIASGHQNEQARAAREALAATAAIEAPTSEAAAEKPQDDRNAASPAAPAFQDGTAASGAWQRLLDAAKESIRLHDEVTGGYDYGYISLDLRFAIEAVEAEKVAQTGMAGAAKGGITNEESALRLTQDEQAAQPAANPAPVPAQGIDHAKLITDALELAYDLAVEQHAEIAVKYEGYKPHKHAAAARDVAMAKEALAIWQARGQQAGGAEGFVQAVREMLDNDGGDGSRYDAGALIKARDSVKAMLAAAPGEEG